MGRRLSGKRKQVPREAASVPPSARMYTRTEASRPDDPRLIHEVIASVLQRLHAGPPAVPWRTAQKASCSPKPARNASSRCAP